MRWQGIGALTHLPLAFDHRWSHPPLVGCALLALAPALNIPAPSLGRPNPRPVFTTEFNPAGLPLVEVRWRSEGQGGGGLVLRPIFPRLRRRFFDQENCSRIW